MKNTFYILLFCGFSAFSQHAKRTFVAADLKPSCFTLSHKQIQYLGHSSYFTVYDKTTHLNDNYSVFDGKYCRTNSRTFSNNSWMGTKIDSFNPNGTNNVGTAVVSGFLNIIFGKH